MNATKQQADSYVEMFKDYVHPISNNATHCAIIHVEGLIKEIEEIYYTCERCVELRFILNELKSRI
jgi:hypothetical protein